MRREIRGLPRNAGPDWIGAGKGAFSIIDTGINNGLGEVSGIFFDLEGEMNLILSLFEIHKGNFQFIVRPLKSDLDGHKPRSLVDDHIDFISQVISPEIEV